MARVIQAYVKERSTTLRDGQNWRIILTIFSPLRIAPNGGSSTGRLCEYVEAWRKRLAQEECERRMRAKQLRPHPALVQACAHHLAQDFGASKVYLFGSLLREDMVHARSDIDLAVEGLEGTRYFEALSAVWKHLPAGVELDLVLLEEAWPGRASESGRGTAGCRSIGSRSYGLTSLRRV